MGARTAQEFLRTGGSEPETALRKTTSGLGTVLWFLLGSLFVGVDDRPVLHLVELLVFSIVLGDQL